MYKPTTCPTECKHGYSFKCIDEKIHIYKFKERKFKVRSSFRKKSIFRHCNEHLYLTALIETFECLECKHQLDQYYFDARVCKCCGYWQGFGALYSDSNIRTTCFEPLPKLVLD